MILLALRYNPLLVPNKPLRAPTFVKLVYYYDMPALNGGLWCNYLVMTQEKWDFSNSNDYLGLTER